MPKKKEIEEECEDCYPPNVPAERLAKLTGRTVEEINSYKESGVIPFVINEKGTAWENIRFPEKECLEKIKTINPAE